MTGLSGWMDIRSLFCRGSRVDLSKPDSMSLLRVDSIPSQPIRKANQPARQSVTGELAL